MRTLTAWMLTFTVAHCLACRAAEVVGGKPRSGPELPDAQSGGGTGGDKGGGDGGAGGAAGGAEPCPDVGAKRICPPNSCTQGTQECLAGNATAIGGSWGPCKDLKDVPGCHAPDAGAVEVPCDCTRPTPTCESYCSIREKPDAPCSCTNPTPACADYCKVRDGGAPDAYTGPPSCNPDEPCHVGEVQVCDVGSCAGIPLKVCLQDQTWSACLYHGCSSEKGGAPGTCSSHLECPRHQLCENLDSHGVYQHGVCTDYFNADINQLCETDADCHPFQGGLIPTHCHPHGICIIDCLVAAECPHGQFCDGPYRCTPVHEIGKSCSDTRPECGYAGCPDTVPQTCN